LPSGALYGMWVANRSSGHHEHCDTAGRLFDGRFLRMTGGRHSLQWPCESTYPYCCCACFRRNRLQIGWFDAFAVRWDESTCCAWSAGSFYWIASAL